MSNLALNLVASVARIPVRTAAITDEHPMTYVELDTASARLTTLLERKGISAGDRVGVMLPNIAAAPIAYYGIWRLGAIVVPMNPLMQGREVQFYLSNTDSKALIGSPGFAGAATDGAESAGASAELDELRQFVKGRVAAYKYPRRFWFVDSLPTGPTGKLLRREVKPPPSEEA